MVHAKSKKTAGLGNALMNDRFGKNRGNDRKKTSAITRVNHATGEEYLTNERQEASWVKMRSVTEQGALDEFLATAELAGTDFTAEKMNNIKIIHTDQKNPYLLSGAEERGVLAKQKDHKGRLTVPRRPKWDASTTPEELDRKERDSFLDWRRGLAELQENHDLLMTPFERNLEVWRQLWRVIERSDLVVQIVDARNPLLFRSEDLESYVKDIDSKKENLLLINKADMLTLNQRKMWAKYLKENGIAYRFFSASLAKEMLEALEEEDENSDEDEPEAGSSSQAASQSAATGKEAKDKADEEHSEEEDGQEEGGAGTSQQDGEVDDDDIRILTVEELEDIFLSHAPENAEPGHKLQIGLVGYPNVGKSSTINALIGAKKVSVSSTPGKTKHFQTIHLSDNVILCDCPGLVFPNFANTKADLVCNGVLPIDQLREFQGPAGLVTRRIPKAFLEAVYGINIKTRALEEGGTGIPTAPELLRAYARARGFTTQGLGQPDESRASRYILKDYVNGKLLYCEPPPETVDGPEFNYELYNDGQLPEKTRQAVDESLDIMSFVGDDISIAPSDLAVLPAGPKSKKIDKGFFGADGTGTGHLKMPFAHKYSEQGQKHLSGRKARAMIALENGVDPKDVKLSSGKKHFKGGAKTRKTKKPADEDDD
ncbi:Putative GTP binding domain, P-loop containing nucleoside triphosphate hydrolase, Ras GTPase GNL1 [Colletotrichum destructivum]|uniref:GTP binding domain, P-loop containing nucleoside triphosphate hydrolase, Ras GTPase GNL1 n=1 Tax=Colletotrichum destructivum TaxID=34406 RepID=A0AAX4I903_9PEZI|nr:Putative GTP binding domain, P-loop containing nucleoside triphosphate hydrolase, Ras GTPase GNL1 [Colletotrichum destructivum]